MIVNAGNQTYGTYWSKAEVIPKKNFIQAVIDKGRHSYCHNPDHETAEQAERFAGSFRLPIEGNVISLRMQSDIT